MGKAKAKPQTLKGDYGDVGGWLVAKWKKDIEETKCCGLVVLPGVMTRLYFARTINEAVRRRQKDTLSSLALELAAKGERNAARFVIRKARKIRVRLPVPHD